MQQPCIFRLVSCATPEQLWRLPLLVLRFEQVSNDSEGDTTTGAAKTAEEASNDDGAVVLCHSTRDSPN